MQPYQFLPHTADVRIEANGKNLEEAFTNCAYAVTDVMVDHTKVKARVEKEIIVTSENQESLMYDFLKQFLILLDSEGFLLSEVKGLTIKNNHLTAQIVGDNNPEKYEHKTHVKAITYQEMKIEESKKGFLIHFIVDI